MHRKNIAPPWLVDADKEMETHRREVLTRKGSGSCASTYEILGVLTEEFGELIAAVKSRDPLQVQHELKDIRVFCDFALACMLAGTLDW